MADTDPSASNDYQVAPTETFSRLIWNAVMASIAGRLRAREELEASFEVLISGGTQAALDMIQVNVGPQLAAITEQVTNLEESIGDLISGGTAPNALQLGGKNPSYYLALANATGTLPVAQVSGVQALVDAAIAGIVNGSPATLDTLKELSDALGGDANFATSVAEAIGLRAPLASPQLTGTPLAPTAPMNTNSAQIATTAFVVALLAARAVRFDAAQALSGAQKAQAIANMGAQPALGFTPVNRAGDAMGNLSIRSDLAGGAPWLRMWRSGVYHWGMTVGSDAKLVFQGADDGVTKFEMLADGRTWQRGSVNLLGGAEVSTDGNVYMPWAGNWLSNILNAKVLACRVVSHTEQAIGGPGWHGGGYGNNAVLVAVHVSQRWGITDGWMISHVMFAYLQYQNAFGWWNFAAT